MFVPSDGSGSVLVVLSELRVENLLLIERASLRLRPGLNVLTGETGAGKTVLASALDLLLGGRAKAGLVRPGAAEAYVEGCFELTDDVRSVLGDRLPADAEDVVLARRVSAEGRSRAWINGRSCGVGDLREVAEGLISFYGQHEHRKLVLASAQLGMLDAFCGAAHAKRLVAYRDVWSRVRALAASLDGLRERAGARDRELDLLEFELREIDELSPSVEEEAELVERRNRLRHIEALRAGSLGAAEALDGEEGSALHGLSAAAAACEPLGSLDAAVAPLSERAAALLLEATDLAGELRAYGEGLEAEPGELDAVEERLAALDRVKRKHGGTIEAVLAHAASCRARRDELASAEADLSEAEAALAEAREELLAVGGELTAARAKAAPKLAKAVRATLAKLAMEAASFDVAVDPRDEPGPAGCDVVEFRIAANPGVPAAPLREVASGGELSRVMLALLGVANDGGEATLVFDEVDAGIGGVTARAVGEQLRDLGAGRQVVCITHLPQIASLAAQHFSIEKDTSVEPARTTVRTLGDKEVVGELVRMLGATDDDVAARRHAKELLKAA